MSELSPDERAAAPAFLQRCDVRLSTIDRVGGTAVARFDADSGHMLLVGATVMVVYFHANHVRSGTPPSLSIVS